MNFVETSLLRVGYQEFNPASPNVVILLHGWPDSPRTWKGVIPYLVDAGYRVIVPALRGFSPTTFLRDDTPRTGQLTALGRDLIELIDALHLHRPVVVGHDWGARAVAVANGLQPGVSSHMVMISVGYGANAANQAMSMAQSKNYWYQWFMNTPRGCDAVRNDRHALAKIMWDTWAPPGWYELEEFNETAQAFENPDWPEVVIQSYTQRWGLSPSDPHYAEDEKRLQPTPMISIPTLILHGEEDGATLTETSANKEAFFSGPYKRVLMPGVGHFPQREAPQQVANEILNWIRQ